MFRSTHTTSAVRTLLVFAVLSLGLVSGFRVASAGAPEPDRDSGCAVAAVDYPVLIGSGYEGHAAVAACDEAATSGDLYNAILAGSGYEGQVIIAERDTASASDTLFDSVLAGSGYEGHAPVDSIATIGDVHP